MSLSKIVAGRVVSKPQYRVQECTKIHKDLVSLLPSKFLRCLKNYHHVSKIEGVDIVSLEDSQPCTCTTCINPSSPHMVWEPCKTMVRILQLNRLARHTAPDAPFLLDTRMYNEVEDHPNSKQHALSVVLLDRNLDKHLRIEGVDPNALHAWKKVLWDRYRCTKRITPTHPEYEVWKHSIHPIFSHFYPEGNGTQEYYISYKDGFLVVRYIDIPMHPALIKAHFYLTVKRLLKFDLHSSTPYFLGISYGEEKVYTKIAFTSPIPSPVNLAFSLEDTFL